MKISFIFLPLTPLFLIEKTNCLLKLFPVLKILYKSKTISVHMIYSSFTNKNYLNHSNNDSQFYNEKFQMTGKIDIRSYFNSNTVKDEAQLNRINTTKNKKNYQLILVGQKKTPLPQSIIVKKILSQKKREENFLITNKNHLTRDVAALLGIMAKQTKTTRGPYIKTHHNFQPETTYISDEEWKKIGCIIEDSIERRRRSSLNDRPFLDYILSYIALNPTHKSIADFHWASFKILTIAEPNRKMQDRCDTWKKHGVFQKIGPFLFPENQHLLIRVQLYTPEA